MWWRSCVCLLLLVLLFDVGWIGTSVGCGRLCLVKGCKCLWMIGVLMLKHVNWSWLCMCSMHMGYTKPMMICWSGFFVAATTPHCLCCLVLTTVNHQCHRYFCPTSPAHTWYITQYQHNNKRKNSNQLNIYKDTFQFPVAMEWYVNAVFIQFGF